MAKEIVVSHVRDVALGKRTYHYLLSGLVSRVLYVDGTENYYLHPQNKTRMSPSGLLRREALVKTDVSEELSAYITRVTRIGELGTTIAITNNQRTLLVLALHIVFLRSVRLLLVTPNVVHSSPILVTLIMEVLGSSEMSVLNKSHTAYQPRI
jgi:hypothetical protein